MEMHDIWGKIVQRSAEFAPNIRADEIPRCAADVLRRKTHTGGLEDAILMSDPMGAEPMTSHAPGKYPHVMPHLLQDLRLLVGDQLRPAQVVWREKAATYQDAYAPCGIRMIALPGQTADVVPGEF